MADLRNAHLRKPKSIQVLEEAGRVVLPFRVHDDGCAVLVPVQVFVVGLQGEVHPDDQAAASHEELDLVFHPDLHYLFAELRGE